MTNLNTGNKSAAFNDLKIAQKLLESNAMILPEDKYFSLINITSNNQACYYKM